MILPKNFSGEGTLFEAGTDATHGERNRGSVVAFAIASVVPDSGMSAGAAAFCAAVICAKKENTIAKKYFILLSAFGEKIRRVEFTISRKARQPVGFFKASNCNFGNLPN